MKCDDDIVKYLNTKFSTLEIIDLLKQNTLYFKFADKFINKKNDEKSKMLNRLLNSLNMAAACNIFSDLKKMNIEYIAFKGFVLSQLLYGSPNERAWGDIDFFVKPQCFNKIYMYLLEEGFKLLHENGLSNPHHVVLTNGRKVIELHRNLFHPMIEINEDFLRENLKLCIIQNQEITTFNETACILHLIYHLYMDTYLVSDSLYSVITSKRILQADRFIYRAYEISLFSETYFRKIKWEDIESDLKKQRLRIIFSRMIFDIVEIFPNAFPDSFLKTVSQLNYIENENDRFYKYLIEADKYGGEYSFDCILSKYINDTWLFHKNDNIHIKIGSSFIVNEKETEKADGRMLSCEVRTEKTSNGIKLCFTVSDDDLYFSDVNNYDTMASDGVHLILCGMGKYSYKSIFFFPKKINEKIKVVAVNVLNNINEVIEKTFVRAEFMKTKNGYSIVAALTNEFIDINRLKPYFYMGVVISDCNRKTMLRQRSLILSKDDSQWYNPSYFAKIEMT